MLSFMKLIYAETKKFGWFQMGYTKVLVDPPRMVHRVLPLIAQTKANALLYVSCHPASLARDT
jgi:23S rRNA (uracil1939-C5)-methyltransferase